MTEKPIFTPEQEKELLKWYKKGASDFWVSEETGFPIEDICRWRAQGDNNALVVKLGGHGVWKATKIVNDPKNERDAQWLLTHHKESKNDWSDRVEHTGKGGKDLIQLSDERKAEIANALEEIL